jgi:hypothetical protein
MKWDLPRLAGGEDHFSLSRRVAGAQFNSPARCGSLLLGGAHRFPGIGPVFKTTLRKELALLLIVTGGAVIADGYIQRAGAQCAGDTQIYVDPRLVPQRPHMTRQQFIRAMLAQMWRRRNSLEIPTILRTSRLKFRSVVAKS